MSLNVPVLFPSPIIPPCITLKTFSTFDFFFVFGGTVVWTQGLTFARQVLYHLSRSASAVTSGFLIIAASDNCYVALGKLLIFVLQFLYQSDEG
jgi:hypothetical protein